VFLSCLPFVSELTCVCRATSSVILSIVYDLPPLKTFDEPFAIKTNDFVNRVSSASYPGAYLVDLFPLLDYVPAWAARWKRDAQKDFKFYSALFENKFKAIKERMVRLLFGNMRRVHSTFRFSQIKGEEHRNSFCASVAENQEKMSISDVESAWLAGTL